MSSAVTFKFERPVSVDDWTDFAAKNGIGYSPNTVGQNVFYGGTDRVVEIAFGESNRNELPSLPNGMLNFDAARPPSEASKLRVSTFHMGDLEAVAQVANAVRERFGGEVASDPELETLIMPVKPG
jgi:hypothetical protein